MRLRALYLILITCLLLAPTQSGVKALDPLPYLVKDVNSHTSDGSKFFTFTEAGSFTYFFTSSGAASTGLWKSDGTAVGTIFLKAVAPAGYPQAFPEPISGMLDGFVFFCAGFSKYPNGDMEHGAELWRSDGTPDGTQFVADLVPGTDGSYPRNFILMGGKLYFVAGVSLWRLDAADQAPVHVWGDTNTPYSNTVGSPLMVLGDHLYFSASDSNHGTELWHSDGTPEGTTYLADLNPGAAGSGAFPLLVGSGKLYFRATDGISGDELWVFDFALSSIHIVANIAPGPAGSSPNYLKEMSGSVFFRACEAEYGCELYRTEGDGATRLTDLVSGSSGSYPSPLGPISTATGQGMLFWAQDSADNTDLYFTDGSPGGEQLLLDQAALSYSYLLELAFFEGKAYFVADDPAVGLELWETDGTVEGTRLFKDIRPGDQSSMPANFVLCGSRLCFTANDGDHGTELWSTAGSLDSTGLAADLNTDAPGSYPGSFIGAGKYVYFLASDGTHPNSLWRSDGSSDGTQQVVANLSDTLIFGFRGFAAVGDLLYFSLKDEAHGQELWRTDGTPEGTQMIKDIYPGPFGSYPDYLTAYQGKLFFTADDSTHGMELWQSDGTEAGTTLFVDLTPGAANTIITHLQVFDGQLIFIRAATAEKRALWRTDGTQVGTRLVADNLPEPNNFAEANQRLFFTAWGTPDGLWQTDASLNGIQSVPAPACLGQFEELRGLTAVNNVVYFINISMQTHTQTLLRTRGAEYGVECVWSHSLPGAGFSYPINPLVAFAGKVIFDAPGENNSRTIWISDGTSAGTYLFPGKTDSILNMLPFGPFLYFPGQADASGRELWVWDGGEAQPYLVKDILPGVKSSSPNGLFAWNHRLYFAASDGVTPSQGHGTELWAYDIPAQWVWLPVISR